MKVALITGITGQDGSYLADFLLEKSYEVHGIKRRLSTSNKSRIDHLYDEVEDKILVPNFFIHYGDITDIAELSLLISKIKPDEIYNLAAQSHVKISFDVPVYTCHADALGVLNILESIRICGLEKHTKIYQASTSELYGKVTEIPQKETTPFYPRSPYSIAKLAGYWYVVNYREAYGIFACNGILFNHESPRRSETFVTRKITKAISKIISNKQDCLYLGNLNASRDWGYAGDYVECMWLMLQQDEPDDFVIATGETHTVREFVEEAFKIVGWKIVWEGEGVNEVGINVETGKIVVRVNANFFRPTEVDYLVGDSSKAKQKLGWNPNKTSFKKLIEDMVKNDCS